ncbi:MAG: PDZ domain-containing protein [Gammaproteobacteria bacterium]|nr:PDZ domain-containing protein [Gammaproteobacteria bacterium]
MKRASFICLLGWFALAGSPAVAQEEATENQEIERKLDEAQERLEEAAREVAELSAELGGGVAAAMEGLHFGMRRAMLGINIGGSSDRNDDGVEVTGVSPGGPADEAGIEAGDVLVSLQGHALAAGGDGKPVRRLLDIMREIEPGERVTVEYLRDGNKEEAEIEAGEFGPHAFLAGLGDEDFAFEFEFPPHFPGMSHFFSQWGRMELTSLTPGLGNYFGTDEGLLVVRAPENEALMLQDGDVIVSIAGREPESPSHALRILRSYRPGETLRIDIVREQEPQSLEFVMPENGEGVENAAFRLQPGNGDIPDFAERASFFSDRPRTKSGMSPFPAPDLNVSGGPKPWRRLRAAAAA